MNRPQIGRLNRRIVLERRADQPAGAFGMVEQRSDGVPCWADVMPVSGSAWQDGRQTGTEVTHRFLIRYRTDVTLDHEITYNGIRYRVQRVSDLDDRRRFTVIDALELGVV
ncbi:phage head closure protein [Chitinibacteraceae bacterium HSL-7]